MSVQTDNLINTGKKGIKRLLFSRTAVIVLLLIIQFLVLLVLFGRLRRYLPYTYWGITLLTLFSFIVIVNRKGNPAYKLAWMLPILLFPVFGVLFYVFLEYQITPKIINRLLLNLDEEMKDYAGQDEAVRARLRDTSPETANLAHYLYENCHFPVYDNTQVRYYSCGEDMYGPLLEELRRAQSFIFMEYFSFLDGKMWSSILEILKEKAASGVEVRFLYDGTCSFSNPWHYADTLEKYGIRCRAFNQIRPILSTVQNNRDHRKITVVDGYTAFTGGVNLEDAYINAEPRYGYWKDSAVRLRGDAVRSFTCMFLQSWNLYTKKKDTDFSAYFPKPLPLGELLSRFGETETRDGQGFVIPYADSPMDSIHVGESVYMDIIYNAKRYVHISTPYLILDNEMVTALTYAARRGVDVRILMPGIPDKPYAFAVAKTFYPELLEAGVRIFQFTPGFVHAKNFVSDDEKAVVGTINMDYRSLYLHFECAAFFSHMDAVLQVEQDFQETLKSCVEITPQLCRREKLLTRIGGRLLRLVAPLM